MDIEKTLSIAAPAEAVWAMLLDPQVMAGCVPGMQSIEVLSDTEYLALMHVKISFVSAKFKLKTKIVEQRAPHYLRSEGTGEDTSVASSLKQQTEVFLSEISPGQTELRLKVKVDVLGRLGTFGLTVMKTKSDRLWEEFAHNLQARLQPDTHPNLHPGAAADLPATSLPTGAVDVSSQKPQSPPGKGAAWSVSQTTPHQVGSNWWEKLLGRPTRRAGFIRVELRRGDTQLNLDWPVAQSGALTAWLLQVMNEPGR